VLGVPLIADIHENVYEQIFMHRGLAAYLTGLDWLELNALDGDGLGNHGKLAEQFVGSRCSIRSNRRS
jgi:hypothetical protein